jgi:hypothetical protein
MESPSGVQAYSIVADLLSKFHTAPEWIQALWLVTVPVTVLGTAFCLLQIVKEIAGVFARRSERQGVPLYVVYEDADGRLMLDAPGAVREWPGEGAEEARLLVPLQRR